MAAEIAVTKINTSHKEDGYFGVTIIISVVGASSVTPDSVERTGRCLAELGRVIRRISKKYDFATRSSRQR